MAKGKSLLNKTNKKVKKVDKYSEISNIKREYKFEVSDTIKLIYLGLIEEYKGETCTIIKRSRRKNMEYYKIKFEGNEEEVETSVGFLKTSEEYEEYLLEQENNSEDINDVSDMERKILESGLIPMKNLKSCHNQLKFYHRDCPSCGYEPVCMYYKKYKYNKAKFN